MYYAITILTLVVFGLSFLKQITVTWERLLLLLILGVASIHALSFNTDAEDAYIAYRYAQNFALGNGLVFNPDEHVEGYSDFIWVVLLGTLHKITSIDLPFLARWLSFLFTMLSIVYTYILSKKITQGNQKLSLLVTLILACSGSFIAYALGGLETPLFSFLLLLLLHFLINKKWMAVGVTLALATMTRPEGLAMCLPIFIAVVVDETTGVKHKIGALLHVFIGAMILLMPWTVWRIIYYGYLLPNPMAAKEGMDKAFQFQFGLTYLKGHWLRVNIVLCVALIGLTLMNLKKWRKIITLVSILVLYSLVYLYIGGDWMPSYRFYSPFYPIMALTLAMLLNNYWAYFKTVLQTAIVAFAFQLGAIYMLIISYNDSYMIPAVQLWSEQVKGLGEIGKWFNASLPKNTVVATFPNGAFSFYNELYTIDVAGLTDEHIARRGLRFSQGMPGHIAHDEYYVLGRNPDIIAVMYGQGFESGVSKFVPEPYTQQYVAVSFQFLEGTNKYGNYVNLLINKNRAQELIPLLAKQNIIPL
jgi:arabinofuranosyltransferase